MPRKGDFVYTDMIHEQKREYMTEYRNRMKNSFVHFKRKTGLKSNDVTNLSSLEDKVAFLKLYDHFGDHKSTVEFLAKYAYLSLL